MAFIAQAATLEAQIPFLHFFDGFRTSNELDQATRTVCRCPIPRHCFPAASPDLTGLQDRLVSVWLAPSPLGQRFPLADLSALSSVFEKSFGSPAVRTEWFQEVLKLAFVTTITGTYST